MTVAVIITCQGTSKSCPGRVGWGISPQYLPLFFYSSSRWTRVGPSSLCPCTPIQVSRSLLTPDLLLTTCQMVARLHFPKPCLVQVAPGPNTIKFQIFILASKFPSSVLPQSIILILALNYSLNPSPYLQSKWSSWPPTHLAHCRLWLCLSLLPNSHNPLVNSHNFLSPSLTQMKFSGRLPIPSSLNVFLILTGWFHVHSLIMWWFQLLVVFYT